MTTVSDTGESLADWLESRAAMHPASAVSVAVWTGGEVAAHTFGEYSGPFGAARIPLGCLSKLFTAHAILALERRGVLSLHDSAQGVMRAHGFGALTLPDDISIGHLLAHTAGLASFPLEPFRSHATRPWPCGDETFHLEAVAPPGEAYCYSNTGYVVLTQIVRLLTGLHWLDAMRELVFAPLADRGLAEALPAYGPETAGPWDNHIGGWAHDISIGIEDLCRYGAIHAGPEASLDGELREIVARMRACPGWAPRLGVSDIKGMGFKHMVSGDYGHFGWTPFGRIGLYVSPRRGACAAIIVSGEVEPLYQDIMAKLDFSSVPLSLRGALQGAAPTAPDGYLGVYRSGAFDITITGAPDRLVAVFGDGWTGRGALPREMALRRLKPRLYVAPIPYMPIHAEFLGPPETARFDYLRYNETLLRADPA